MADNYKYTKKYDEDNTKRVQLKLNKKTDADILEYLDSVDNKQGTIKRLIREEIEREGKEIILIYTDSIDDSADIKGYIFGTGEEADAYCEEYNSKLKRFQDELFYRTLDKLN